MTTSTLPGRDKRARSPYPYWFYLPAASIYALLFLLPTFASFFFSLTRWDMFTATFVATLNWWCRANSRPRSTVNDSMSPAGSCWTAAINAAAPIISPVRIA